MAKITYNPAVKHMHGHVGDLVFKTRDGRNLMAAKPDQVNQPNTPAQQQQKEQFRLGAFYAKGIMANALARAPYAAKAKEVHKPAFALILGITSRRRWWIRLTWAVITDTSANRFSSRRTTTLR